MISKQKRHCVSRSATLMFYMLGENIWSCDVCADIQQRFVLSTSRLRLNPVLPLAPWPLGPSPLARLVCGASQFLSRWRGRVKSLGLEIPYKVHLPIVRFRHKGLWDISQNTLITCCCNKDMLLFSCWGRLKSTNQLLLCSYTRMSFQLIGRLLVNAFVPLFPEHWRRLVSVTLTVLHCLCCFSSPHKRCIGLYLCKNDVSTKL